MSGSVAVRTDRGRWFWVALVGNLPIVLLIGWIGVGAVLHWLDPDPAKDSGNGFGATEVLAAVVVLGGMYLIALARFALRLSWVWLVPFDLVVGSFLVLGALGNLGHVEIRLPVLGVLAGGIALLVAAAAIVRDRVVRGRSLPRGSSTAALGDPGLRQGVILGAMVVGLLLGIWLWSAIEEAQ